MKPFDVLWNSLKETLILWILDDISSLGLFIKDVINQGLGKGDRESMFVQYVKFI